MFRLFFFAVSFVASVFICLIIALSFPLSFYVVSVLFNLPLFSLASLCSCLSSFAPVSSALSSYSQSSAAPSLPSSLCCVRLQTNRCWLSRCEMCSRLRQSRLMLIFKRQSISKRYVARTCPRTPPWSVPACSTWPPLTDDA